MTKHKSFLVGVKRLPAKVLTHAKWENMIIERLDHISREGCVKYTDFYNKLMLRYFGFSSPKVGIIRRIMEESTSLDGFVFGSVEDEEVVNRILLSGQQVCAIHNGLNSASIENAKQRVNIICSGFEFISYGAKFTLVIDHCLFPHAKKESCCTGDFFMFRIVPHRAEDSVMNGVFFENLLCEDYSLKIYYKKNNFDLATREIIEDFNEGRGFHALTDQEALMGAAV